MTCRRDGKPSCLLGRPVPGDQQRKAPEQREQADDDVAQAGHVQTPHQCPGGPGQKGMIGQDLKQLVSADREGDEDRHARNDQIVGA